MVVAESWFSSADLMVHVEVSHHGTLVVQGKSSYVFRFPDGRRVTGGEVIHGEQWPWRQSLHAPSCRSARLIAQSQTFGEVTVLVVDEPGEDRIDLLCRSSHISATRLLRAWKRRHWIEHVFRTLKHLLATKACQVRSEDAYYGHLVLRLMACFVLFYTSRVIDKGRVTMEQMVFRVKHHWVTIDWLKANRQVDDSAGKRPYQRVDTRDWSAHALAHGQRIKIKGFPQDHTVQCFRVEVSPHRTDDVVTNDQAQDATEATQEVCGFRWKIEPLHREGKHVTGLERCQCRKARIQRNHIGCAFLVWVRLKDKGCPHDEQNLQYLRMSKPGAC